jgi:hypothetical protein
LVAEDLGDGAGQRVRNGQLQRAIASARVLERHLHASGVIIVISIIVIIIIILNIIIIIVIIVASREARTSPRLGRPVMLSHWRRWGKSCQATNHSHSSQRGP